MCGPICFLPNKGLTELSLIIFRDTFDADLLHFMI